MADEKPQDIVARQFMRHKGYPGARARDVEKLEGQPCWYFLYDLPDGTLELEVFWNVSTSEWETNVCTFKVANSASGR